MNDNPQLLALCPKELGSVRFGLRLLIDLLRSDAPIFSGADFDALLECLEAVTHRLELLDLGNRHGDGRFPWLR